jgi:hypothetical protein
MPEPAATETEQPKGAFARLADLAVAALPPLVSAIGVVTFVALIGGAIQWVRFWAAGLPADQAVRAMPKQELVVIGAVSLVGFLLAGVLVVLVVFLIVRQALDENVTPRVLLALTTLEMMVALVVVDEEWWVLGLLAVWFVVLGLVSNELVSGLPSILRRLSSRKRLWAIRSRFERAKDDHDDAESHVTLLPPGADGDAIELRSAALREATVQLEAARREWARALDDWGASKADEIAELPRRTPPTKSDLFKALQALAEREKHERGTFSDRRLWGATLLATIAAGAIPLALSDDSRWLLAVLAVVALLGAVNFMIARITPRFAWYGLAIFASVTLFGAALSVVRTIRSPKVQPVALLRTGDDRPICGAYVTESDKRVYIARVVPEPKGDGTRSKLGRVFWIDVDDVDTVSVGPLQSVRSARKRLPTLAREIAADRPEAAPAKPKPVVKTTVVKRSRGRRAVTVTTVTEEPPKPPKQPGGGAPAVSVERPAADSCT